MKISKRLNLVGEYVFSRLARAKVDVERVTGIKVLDLSIGSPDIPPSPKYVNKLNEFVKDKKAHLYPGYGALPEFSQAVARWYKNRFGVKVDEKSILPLLGAKEGVSYLPLALVDKGSEVLIPDPGYPAFSGPAEMLGAKLVFYNANGNIDIGEIERKISKKTAYIWINMPANPTGMVADVKVLSGMVRVARQHGVWLIYDNAYSEITFDGYVAPSIFEIKGAEDIAIEIGSFSKSHSFAGYRMGWAVGNMKLIEAIKKVKSQFDSGMSVPLQKLGGYVLDNPDGNWHKQMLKSYQMRRNKLVENLKKIGMIAEKPKGGLYLWVEIPQKYKDSEEFVFDLLKKKNILMTPGTAFGKNGKQYVRISISSNIDGIESYFK